MSSADTPRPVPLVGCMDDALNISFEGLEGFQRLLEGEDLCGHKHMIDALAVADVLKVLIATARKTTAHLIQQLYGEGDNDDDEGSQEHQIPGA